MKLSELLVDAWVVLPFGSEELSGALGEILARVASTGAIEEGRVSSLAHELVTGEAGEVVRVSEGVVAVLATVAGAPGLRLGVGVASGPLALPGEGRGGPGAATAVVLALTPGRLAPVRQTLVPALARALKDRARVERLAAVSSVVELRAFRDLMDVEYRPRLLVEDALVPVRYRVYPDTPLTEVVDLMVRRGVHAVPVVGERYEVLGILTSGDALGYLLGAEGRDGAGDGKGAARDFMTRTVLCVSEGQALTEAANMMVNRDVEQLPVVRDGELVGFVTRDSILRALKGAPRTDENPTETE